MLLQQDIQWGFNVPCLGSELKNLRFKFKRFKENLPKEGIINTSLRANNKRQNQHHQPFPPPPSLYEMNRLGRQETSGVQLLLEASLFPLPGQEE